MSIKGLFTAAWKLLRKILAPVIDLIGCIGGIVGGGIIELSHFGGPSHHLSSRVKTIMRAFFPTVDLDAVRIKTHVAVPFGKRAFVLGHRIHFTNRFDECEFGDMKLLMHELVHVRQFEKMGWVAFMCDYGQQLLQRGYSNSWLELEADEFEKQHASELKPMVKDACGSDYSESGTEAVEESAFWLIWGGT